MKTVSRVVKTVLVILCFMLAIGVGAIAFVWTHPQRTWEFIESKILPSDLKINWQSLHISTQRLAGLDFTVDFEVKQMLIRKSEPKISIPLQNAQLKFSIFPFKKEEKIIFHELSLLSTEQIYFRPNPSKPPKDEKNPFEILNEYLFYLNWIRKNIRIEKINAHLQKVQISLDEREVLLTARVNQTSDKWTIDVNGEMDNQHSLPFTFQSEIPIIELNPSWPLMTGAFTFKLKTLKISQIFELNNHKNVFFINSRGDLNLSRIRFKPTLKIRLSPQLATISLNTPAYNLPGPLAHVSDIRAEITSPLEQNRLLSSKPTFFSVSLAIGTNFVSQATRSIIENSCQCKLPHFLSVRARGETYLANILENSPEKKEILSADMAVNSIRNSFFTVNLGAHLDIFKKDQEYEFLPKMNSVATIHSFRLLRKLLDEKNVLVPAPLDVLEGKIHLIANKEIQKRNNGFSLPIQAIVKLNSKNQIVDLISDAQVEIFPDTKSLAMNIAIDLKSLKLELPPLNPLGGKPRVFKDTRIMKKNYLPAQEKAKEIRVSIALDLQTSRPGGIQLLSKYFKPFLPITMNITTNRKNISGFIKAEPFDVEYLRRKIHVETMRVDISDPRPTNYPVSGRLRVQQTLYTVFIDIEGTVNRPLVHFRSEPYLPEDDVISVLLFDRTRSELGQMDAESAGGFQAAISDRAIGLFGLWAFASTPIRSFYYNPATKIYSATLTLTDNVLASVGTDWEHATQVELRKRISNQWILLATWTPATTSSPEKNKLQLLWQKRF